MSKKKNMFTINVWKNWDELYWLEFEISNSIDAMKEILNHIEKSWVISNRKLNEEIKKFEESLEADEHHSGYPFEYEERFMGEIKSRAFFAVFLSSYAIFEGSLNKLCKLIEAEFDFKLKMEDLNSRGYLDHYKNYLTKIYELNFKDIESDWDKVAKYAELRNLFVHKDGESKKKEIKNKLAKIKNLLFSENTEITLVSIKNKLFFDVFFKELLDFFNKLIQLIDNKYPSWKSNLKKKSLA